MRWYIKPPFGWHIHSVIFVPKITGIRQLYFVELVSWSLTSLFSTNMAISETIYFVEIIVGGWVVSFFETQRSNVFCYFYFVFHNLQLLFMLLLLESACTFDTVTYLLIISMKFIMSIYISNDTSLRTFWTPLVLRLPGQLLTPNVRMIRCANGLAVIEGPRDATCRLKKI